jgi:hypothetical protein
MKSIQARLSKRKDRKLFGIEYIIFPTQLQSVVENNMTWLGVGSRDYTLKSVNYPKTKGMKTVELDDGTLYEEVKFIVVGWQEPTDTENGEYCLIMEDASENINRVPINKVFRIY